MPGHVPESEFFHWVLTASFSLLVTSLLHSCLLCYSSTACFGEGQDITGL